MSEETGKYFLMGGLTVVIFAWLWLLTAAFRTRFWWGVAAVVSTIAPVAAAVLLLTEPLYGLVAGVALFLPVSLFILLHLKRTAVPVLLVLLGVGVVAVPKVYTQFVPLDLGQWDKMVGGERHVTLTGWDWGTYSVLRDMSDAAVLQMANPDVDDGTLRYLRGMDRLRKLDLSDTQITDSGLEKVAALPNLEELYLSRTKITDAGFRRWLMPLPKLRHVGLGGTAVTAETIQEWKDAGTGRRVLR